MCSCFPSLLVGQRFGIMWSSQEAGLCSSASAGADHSFMMVQIDTAGDFGLRVFNPTQKRHHILPVDIALNGAAYLITVGKGTLAPPYRVENRCAPGHELAKLLQDDLQSRAWNTYSLLGLSAIAACSLLLNPWPAIRT